MPNADSPDVRLQQLTAWTRATLKRDDLRISVASADASFRRYFRAGHESQTWVVMDAPPDKEDTGPYIKVAQMLVAAGVNAPRVVAQNFSEGFLLLSDLGARTYLAELTDARRADDLYRDALAALVQMQVGCEPHVLELPPYDAALLKREMELFPEWFLGKHLGLKLAETARKTLESAFAMLIDSALQQPRVFVHRDYHSRNLMMTEPSLHGQNPGVLDFQDAVYGPISYDLVSLLRDCYIEWPAARVYGWMADYLAMARSAGLNVKSDSEFRRGFDLMGVQRHLKAIGIFARLAHRDGKEGYLNDIPRTLGYIDSVLPTYPEFGAFGQLVREDIVPQLKKR